MSSPEPEPVQEETLFELSASTTTFNPHQAVQDPLSNPLYYPYKPAPASRSPIAASLSENVPESLWARGLKDWDTHGMRCRDGELAFAGGVEEGTERNAGSSRSWWLGRESKRTENMLPKVMRGLKALAEERSRREAEESEKRVSLSGTEDAGVAGSESSRDIPTGQERTTPDPPI